MSPSHIRIFSVPTEAGTHFPGQSRAPKASLDAGLRLKLQEAGYDCTAHSLLISQDSAVISAAEWRSGPKLNGVRNEENTLTVLRSIHTDLTADMRLASMHNPGDLAIFLGGDCTILQPILAALNTVTHQPVGLIYMDGDVDLTLPAEAAAGIDHTGILDGMVMTHLTQRAGGLSSMRGAPCSSRPDGGPLITADNVVFFGFDPLQPSPEHWVYLLENGFRAWTRPTVRADPIGAAKAALAWLEARFDVIMLHFDVDVIDCGEFPLANYPHYAGLKPEEAFEALEVFMASPKVRAMTVTEMNPNNSPDGVMIGQLVDAIVQGAKQRKANNGQQAKKSTA